ncbi:MAG: nickel-type superoxide dismutase maturation protease [Myxococcota bacterium]
MGTRRRLIRQALHELVGALRGRRRVYVARGHSMSPTFDAGDVLIVEVCRRLPRPGEVVVFRDPLKPEQRLVKRVRSIGSSTFAVGSDDPAAGRDSRHFGSVTIDHLVGRVRWSISTDGCAEHSPPGV